MKDIKFDLDDIAIVPAILSEINSRSECDIHNDENGLLPLMTAPMDTVVSKKNYYAFISNRIHVCMPRNEYHDNTTDMAHKDIFQSFGLEDLERQLKLTKQSKEKYNKPFFWFNKILIDTANGHLQRVIDVIKKIKKDYPHITIMAGNVGHPLTYKNLAMAGADYVRCSIGTGESCVTAANVGINYPIGSLIYECKEIKKKSELDCKIVADGGMRGYDDIIKSLSLGCDCVMIGSLLNRTLQSAGFNYLWGLRLPYQIAKILWKWGFPIKKKYRGMSTKEVQRKWGKAKLVTSEGITRFRKIKYNLSTWVENFEDYLRSAMSYSGAKNLQEFIENSEWVFITNNSLKRYKK